MDQDIFQTLGLSPNEVKIYQMLVEHGESSISEVATSAQIHRRNAYDAMQRLIDKGLAFQIFSSKENKYNAVDPDKLKELFEEKQKELERALPDLKKKFVNRVTSEEAYIYRGLEGQKNIWRDVLRVGQDSYFIGAKGAWYDPRLAMSRQAFFREANRKKIQFIQLFDYEVGQQFPSFYKNYESKFLKYRILPKKYSTNSAIHIFGDYVITYAGISLGKLDENAVIFVIHSKQLAEDYRKWFWYMWEQSAEKLNIKTQK